MTARTAPWPDFAGHPVCAGDWIAHPSGETGQVVCLTFAEHSDTDRWRVRYKGCKTLSRLALQIGEKGRAVVVSQRMNT